MPKLAIFILFCALVASYGQQSEIADYCQALAGELAACKNHLAECEAQRKDFSMRCQDRERELTAENAKLKAEVQRLLKQRQSLLEEKEKLEAENRSLQQTKQACLNPLAVAEQSLESKRNQLPASLRETMLPPLESGSPYARLRRYLDSLESIRDFTRQPPKPLPMTLTGPDGIQREFQILQLGLSFAYAVAPEAGLAGYGVQSDGTWSWQWKPEWSPIIKNAVDICSGKCPPALLPLPLPPFSMEGGDK